MENDSKDTKFEIKDNIKKEKTKKINISKGERKEVKNRRQKKTEERLKKQGDQLAELADEIMELENKGYGIYELNKQFQEWEIEHQGIITLEDEIRKLEEEWENERKWLEDRKKIGELKQQIKENNKDLTTKPQIERIGINDLRKETDLAKKVKTCLLTYLLGPSSVRTIDSISKLLLSERELKETLIKSEDI